MVIVSRTARSRKKMWKHPGTYLNTTAPGCSCSVVRIHSWFFLPLAFSGARFEDCAGLQSGELPSRSSRYASHGSAQERHRRILHEDLDFSLLFVLTFIRVQLEGSPSQTVSRAHCWFGFVVEKLQPWTLEPPPSTWPIMGCVLVMS